MENLYGFLQNEINPALEQIEKIPALFHARHSLTMEKGYVYLLVVVSGSCNLYLGKQSVRLEGTSVYCFQEPQDRCFVADATAELELYLLGISGIEVLNPYMETACREQKPVEIYEEDRNILRMALPAIRKRGAVFDPMENLLCRQMLLAVLLVFIKNIRKEERVIGKKEDLCGSIKQYIDENYTEDISLNSISRHFFVTPNYVSHIFKEKFGVSPIKYLINKRIILAKHLLMSSNDSVNQIALEVGYDNPAYFSTIFRKTVGVSLANYRLALQRNI